ncbi:uncharacterized protein [Chelonus insularis]|uniref:uncharacterized protein n=1 Tax=Chelonus insularis TaxID=460826 RepID=UPI00158A7FF4|nr:uncharacterized protein LOC118071873 [Chelonus insularis]
MAEYSDDAKIVDEMWINDYESFSTGIKRNANFTKIYSIGRHTLIGHWYRNEAEVQRHYSATWLLLPIGSIFITAVVVLLMVLFNRCSQIITAVVTGILGSIILFIIFILVDEKTIYA